MEIVIFIQGCNLLLRLRLLLRRLRRLRVTAPPLLTLLTLVLHHSLPKYPTIAVATANVFRGGGNTYTNAAAGFSYTKSAVLLPTCFANDLTVGLVITALAYPIAFIAIHRVNCATFVIPALAHASARPAVFHRFSISVAGCLSGSLQYCMSVPICGYSLLTSTMSSSSPASAPPIILDNGCPLPYIRSL